MVDSESNSLGGSVLVKCLQLFDTSFEECDLIANEESTFQDVLVGVESSVHEPPGVSVRVQFRANGAQTLVEQEKTGHLKMEINPVLS